MIGMIRSAISPTKQIRDGERWFLEALDDARISRPLFKYDGRTKQGALEHEVRIKGVPTRFIIRYPQAQLLVAYFTSVGVWVRVDTVTKVGTRADMLKAVYDAKKTARFYFDDVHDRHLELACEPTA